MAVRAALSPPLLRPETWPWHKVRAISIEVSALSRSERRLEAENFLSDGYGIRLSLQAKSDRTVLLHELASVSQPNRLKGIQLPEGHGQPFIAATQVFDYRPIIRKWLSAAHVNGLTDRQVNAGTILVTCSGTVGRATLATAVHENTIISHDLLRVVAHREGADGWLYAWLRAPSVRMMMRSARYGHIIKHLERGHLNELPVVLPPEATAALCNAEVKRIIQWRNDAYQRVLEAERLFAEAFPPNEAFNNTLAFEQPAAILRGQRNRRFDATYYAPQVRAIEKRLHEGARSWQTIEDLGFGVTLPMRFKRVPAENGTPLIGSAQVFEVNPDIEKRIAETNFGGSGSGRVTEGTLLLARSGQIYGVIGSVTMASALLTDYIVSDDVIRVMPENSKVGPGYLQVVLTHPDLGKPRVKALCYGSSIPHIDPTEIKSFKVPRLDIKREQAISDLMIEASNLRAEADLIETELGLTAERVLFDHLSR